MNKPNCIAASQEVKTEVERVEYLASPSSLIRLLWSKKAPLARHELEWVGSLGETAAIELSQVADTVEGIGNLIINDEDSGALQSKDAVARLLYSISNQISVLSEIVYITGDANALLKLAGGSDRG